MRLQPAGRCSRESDNRELISQAHPNSASQRGRGNIQAIENSGGRDRDRTCDPYHVRVGRLRRKPMVSANLARFPVRTRGERGQNKRVDKRKVFARRPPCLADHPGRRMVPAAKRRGQSLEDDCTTKGDLGSFSAQPRTRARTHPDGCRPHRPRFSLPLIRRNEWATRTLGGMCRRTILLRAVASKKLRAANCFIGIVYAQLSATRSFTLDRTESVN